MPPVLVSCPVTGEFVPTGMNVVSLEELDADEYLVIACSQCGRDHVWTPGEAVLAGEPQ